ncbi:MAG: PhnA domain-containing protein [Dysgonamonadaceae bacterium]|nr:PhnA domain-containing protein [Dysgonamonadaceae bacterium]MDD3727648.1 PhnA domain-containing protein [Dysgonamonadaceae bacterium]MDD4246642.1 PhnA domain-containing protein [Dysgonamonadaceae bacterium]MDD4605568.1 PhnA domain-containing protein [Dysgonamonadaceae bacterium]
MSLSKRLEERSKGTCELCEAAEANNIYNVPHGSGADIDTNVHLCDKCLAQIEIKEELESGYWSVFLPTTMWSEVSAVQVLAWRMLNRFRDETWAHDALEMLYLNDDDLEWAKASGEHLSNVEDSLHRDCNGTLLIGGDSVSLIKDLDVKGSTINAKMGTAVRNIRLDPENSEFIEGKIDGQNIVILTKFVRKIN